MEEENVFTGKTEEEAIQEGLLTLGILREEAEIEVVEEGKKKLFGSSRWKVRVTKKSASDGERAVQFIDGLLKILGIEGESAVISEGDTIKIEITTKASARVIGKRGDVLDAIQCMAGAVANMGREDYKKVVVDCENYRSQREETLTALAQKLANKALETGRKIILEPMNPYERRIIHAALAGNEHVKTASEGKEPARYVVVIPENARPGDRGIRYGERRRPDRDGRGRGFRRDRDRDRDQNGRGGFENRGRGDRRFDKRRSAPSGGEKRAKKEIRFGTFLGNSGAKTEETPAPDPTPTETTEE